jgi:hypothetical protein
MAIVTKGSGGSIKFTGTGGGISITSSGGGGGAGGGGGGGGAPDSSNLYSLLRRGVNQTSVVNELTETIITGWTDARGAGLGHPKFLPQGRWTTGGPARGCTIGGDGSVAIRSDGAGGKATFMRATTDDSNTALSNTTDASWTVYVRFANPLYNGNPIAGTNYIFSAFSNTNDGAGDDTSVGEGVSLFSQSTGWTTGIWRLSVQQPVGGSWTYPVNGETIGSQFVPNPNEYQVAILRVSPSQGWSFRLANSSNGGGSFGSSLAYNAASPFNLGRALWLGGQDGGDYPISDFAVYTSYHNESTATQVVSHLTSAP